MYRVQLKKKRRREGMLKVLVIYQVIGFFPALRLTVPMYVGWRWLFGAWGVWGYCLL